MSELVILKIGGSVITEKEKTDYTVRTAVLHDIFSELKRALEKRPDTKLILVHGAGGHIHYLAHTYELRGGTKNDIEKIHHADEVQRTCIRLNEDVVRIGQTARLPLQSVPTHNVVTNKDGIISHMAVSDIAAALDTGTIPVLYGDMVPDETLGLSVCSGDAIMDYLPKLFEVTQALFASDIDGVYTDDPHQHPDATLIEHVTLSDIKNGVVSAGPSRHIDVTGGLARKLEASASLLALSESIKDVQIFNGLTPDNYIKVFAEDRFPHTTIQR